MGHQVKAAVLPLLAGLVVFASSGCGGPRIATVSGKVTYDGKPLSQGTIMFYPEVGRAAVGQIGSDGSYTLTTFQPGDGALVGPHRVVIHATRVGPGSLVAPKNIEEELELSHKGANGGKILVAGKVEWLVPEKYSQLSTTDLKATVEDRPNTLDFAIPSKPSVESLHQR
jgi:hypothetical protein